MLEEESGKREHTNGQSEILEELHNNSTHHSLTTATLWPLLSHKDSHNGPWFQRGMVSPDYVKVGGTRKKRK